MYGCKLWRSRLAVVNGVGNRWVRISVNVWQTCEYTIRTAIITDIVALVKANCADVDVIVVTLGKANKTDVVADNVVADVITNDVTLGRAN